MPLQNTTKHERSRNESGLAVTVWGSSGLYGSVRHCSPVKNSSGSSGSDSIELLKEEGTKEECVFVLVQLRPLTASRFGLRDSKPLSLTPSPASHHIIHRVHDGHHDPVGSPVHLGIQPNRTVSTPYRPALAVPEQSAVISLRLCCSMTRVQIFTTLGLQPDTARPADFRLREWPTGAHGEANTKGQGKYCSGEKLGRKPSLENSRAE